MVQKKSRKGLKKKKAKKGGKRLASTLIHNLTKFSSKFLKNVTMNFCTCTESIGGPSWGESTSKWWTPLRKGHYCCQCMCKKFMVSYIRDNFVYVPSQWETMLQCNVVSHWLGTHMVNDTESYANYIVLKFWWRLDFERKTLCNAGCCQWILNLCADEEYIDGSVQDCCNSIVNALEYCSLALSHRHDLYHNDSVWKTCH